ncbi:MAG: GAF domain-containing protein [Chloroflexi bacterium]|nr:GAF domain-containing protein [Chloroflexota bacterium]
MSDYNRYLKQETARLKEENEGLLYEVEKLRGYLDAIDTLLEAFTDLDADAEIMPLLDRLLHNALRVINANDGSLLVLDEDTSELVFVIAHGDIDPELIVGRRIPAERGIAGWVVQNRAPTVVQNTQVDDRFYGHLDQELGFHTHSIIAAPIIGAGRVLGVIEALNKRGDDHFDEADRTLLLLLCRFAGEVLNRLVTDGKSAEAVPPTSAE